MSLNAEVMGQRIKSARKMRNMSVATLAEKINYTDISLNHIECGVSRPSLATLYNIANVLDVSMDYLSGRTATSQEAAVKRIAADEELSQAQEEMLTELVKGLIPAIKKKI